MKKIGTRGFSMALAVVSLLFANLAFAGSASATQDPDGPWQHVAPNAPQPPPPAPEGLSYQGSFYGDTIAWNPVASADKYNVYKNGEYVKTVNGNSTSVKGNLGDYFTVVSVNETQWGTLFSVQSDTLYPAFSWSPVYCFNDDFLATEASWPICHPGAF